MKTLSLLVMEADPGSMGDFELIGAFQSDFELVEWLWTELKLRPGFSAWPIGGDRDCADDVAFLENVAELQLRPYYPKKAIAGLGPANVRKVWIKQHHLEGDFNWLVLQYIAADLSDEEATHHKDLRRVMSKGGMVYTHVTSSLGQRIEEDHQRKTARGVQQAITALRTGSAVLSDPVERDELFVCEYCDTAPIPGVIFPMASNGMTNHAYVEQCDECVKYTSDLDAAAVLGHMFRLTIKTTESGRPYVEGMTMEEAEEWRKKHSRPRTQS